MIEPFFTRSGRGFPHLGFLTNPAAHKLRFEDGALFVYGQRGFATRENQALIKLGEIFKPGETVRLSGRYDGSGAIGLNKGIIIRDCSALPAR